MEDESKSQESQRKPGGNTKPPDFQAYKWFFTWPEIGADGEILSPSQISQELKVWCKSFKFQLEKGKEDGYRHFQGNISLINKHNLSTMKNLFGSKIHWERTKDYFAAMNYTGKAETRVDGPWTEESVFVDVLCIDKFYPWQKQCLKICLTEKNDRTINWFWEGPGCRGKTQFCKYMYVNHKALILGNGAFKDIAAAVTENPKIVLMNLTRDLEERINYSALEAVKDGMIFSSKYKSGVKVFNSPVVVVFANYPPRKDSMSLDRWNVIEIGAQMKITDFF